MTIPASLTDYIQQMPKAEIHIHLEGAIQPETVLALARRHNMLDRLPSVTVAELREWFQFTDFPHFVTIYRTIQDLLRTAADFSLIVYENGADMVAQNIRYRELTVTTFTHTHWLNKSLTIEEILEGLEDGRRRAQRDYGVEMRWVFDIPRAAAFDDKGRYMPDRAEITLAHALQGQAQGVVGFGLGGYEVGAPPRPFAHAFRRAREAGLLSVPHAGETEGPNSIWSSLEDLEADRIGHGVRAIEDPDLLRVLRDRQIVLEVNPTSNNCLHIYPSLAMHPFPHLDKMGLRLTVNSDDPPLFNTNLNQEYMILAEQYGYERAGLARIARNAFVASGVEPDVKQQLLSEFDQWQARHNPAINPQLSEQTKE